MTNNETFGNKDVITIRSSVSTMLSL